jgi:hypothetical protein
MLNYLLARAAFHYFLRITVTEGVKGSHPKHVVVNENNLFVHMPLVDNMHPPTDKGVL